MYVSKIEEKMGNFEILSFGRHQNFAFLAEILTSKMRAYTVIFMLFITQIGKLSVSKDCMLYIFTLFIISFFDF